MTALEVEDAVDGLEGVNVYIDRDVVMAWSVQDRDAVTAWAKATYEKAQGSILVDVPERPKVLGKPHIPAKAVPDEHQVCSLCEVVIHAASDTVEPFKETDYVGVDCKGKPDAGHRYPSNKGLKTAAARKKIAPQPKPKAAKKKAKR
jgi:hypothetical protein